MADSASLSFRVSAAKAHDLDRLAEATDRPRSWLLEQALDAYLEVQSWQLAHIAEGLAELDRGEGVSHETAGTWLTGRGAAGEGDAPR